MFKIVFLVVTMFFNFCPVQATPMCQRTLREITDAAINRYTPEQRQAYRISAIENSIRFAAEKGARSMRPQAEEHHGFSRG
jgi:hypothetical protein